VSPVRLLSDSHETYIYISARGEMYFGPSVEIAATTRWRRAFNLELM